MSDSILVTGAGGFIGHHLIKYLKTRGYWVRGVDVKLPEYEESTAEIVLRTLFSLNFTVLSTIVVVAQELSNNKHNIVNFEILLDIICDICSI